MKPSADQRNDFLANRPIPGVSFQHNDSVDITGGEHAGDSGSIVSGDWIGKDPAYLVEPGSGQDVVISQPLLRRIEAQQFSNPDWRDGRSYRVLHRQPVDRAA
jgi:hypothetical protein